jgi:hypothetical protein
MSETTTDRASEIDLDSGDEQSSLPVTARATDTTCGPGPAVGPTCQWPPPVGAMCRPCSFVLLRWMHGEWASLSEAGWAELSWGEEREVEWAGGKAAFCHCLWDSLKQKPILLQLDRIWNYPIPCLSLSESGPIKLPP